MTATATHGRVLLPVLLGSGTPLHGPDGAGRVNLELISSDRSGTVTALRFAVIR
jgi:hypothetical protein